MIFCFQETSISSNRMRIDFLKMATSFLLMIYVSFCLLTDSSQLCSQRASDLFNSTSVYTVNTNQVLECSIDYEAVNPRQWILKKEEYNLTDSLEIDQASVLNITYLDIDSSKGDYLIIGFGIPGQFYDSQALIITSPLANETKSIFIYSPITWLGLINLEPKRSGFSFNFTWTPPILKPREESGSLELRASSVDLCFKSTECLVIHENVDNLRLDLSDKINNYIKDQEISVSLIGMEQVKIIRNETRIRDEKSSDTSYCRVQVAVIGEKDVNWPHSELTQELLSQIWFTNNDTYQTVSLRNGSLLNYKKCEENTFDPIISLQSVGIFVAGLAASIGLWKWHRYNLMSTAKKINIVQVSAPPRSDLVRNPIYESDDEDEIMFTESSRYK